MVERRRKKSDLTLDCYCFLQSCTPPYATRTVLRTRADSILVSCTALTKHTRSKAAQPSELVIEPPSVAADQSRTESDLSSSPLYRAHKACCDLVGHYKWCLSGTP